MVEAAHHDMRHRRVGAEHRQQTLDEDLHGILLRRALADGDGGQTRQTATGHIRHLHHSDLRLPICRRFTRSGDNGAVDLH